MCRAIVLGVGAVLVSASFPRQALACSCPAPAVCSSPWTADVVFVGLAENVARPAPRTEITRLRVEEWFRGERIGEEITVPAYSVGGSCDYGFEQGKRYVVYANHRPDGSWHVEECSGTSPVERAAQQLTYIRDALANPGPGTLSGNAFVDVDPTEGVRLGPFIAGARVALEAGTRRFVATTDSQGQYRFDTIPAGEYMFSADLPPDLTPVPRKRIIIGKGACISHTFWTTKQ